MRGGFCYYIFYCHHRTLLIIVGGAAVECVSGYLITDCSLLVYCYCCCMFTGVEFVKGCERPFPSPTRKTKMPWTAARTTKC